MASPREVADTMPQQSAAAEGDRSCGRGEAIRDDLVKPSFAPSGDVETQQFLTTASTAMPAGSSTFYSSAAASTGFNFRGAFSPFVADGVPLLQLEDDGAYSSRVKPGDACSSPGSSEYSSGSYSSSRVSSTQSAAPAPLFEVEEASLDASDLGSEACISAIASRAAVRDLKLLRRDKEDGLSEAVGSDAQSCSPTACSVTSSVLPAELAAEALLSRCADELSRASTPLAASTADGLAASLAPEEARLLAFQAFEVAQRQVDEERRASEEEATAAATATDLSQAEEVRISQDTARAADGLAKAEAKVREEAAAVSNQPGEDESGEDGKPLGQRASARQSDNESLASQEAKAILEATDVDQTEDLRVSRDGSEAAGNLARVDAEVSEQAAGSFDDPCMDGLAEQSDRVEERMSERQSEDERHASQEPRSVLEATDIGDPEELQASQGEAKAAGELEKEDAQVSEEAASPEDEPHEDESSEQYTPPEEHASESSADSESSESSVVPTAKAAQASAQSQEDASKAKWEQMMAQLKASKAEIAATAAAKAEAAQREEERTRLAEAEVARLAQEEAARQKEEERRRLQEARAEEARVAFERAKILAAIREDAEVSKSVAASDVYCPHSARSDDLAFEMVGRLAELANAESASSTPASVRSSCGLPAPTSRSTHSLSLRALDDALALGTRDVESEVSSPVASLAGSVSLSSHHTLAKQFLESCEAEAERMAQEQADAEAKAAAERAAQAEAERLAKEHAEAEAKAAAEREAAQAAAERLAKQQAEAEAKAAAERQAAQAEADRLAQAEAAAKAAAEWEAAQAEAERLEA